MDSNLWSPARALAKIPQYPEEASRVPALIWLFPLLPDTLKQEALTMARAIQDNWQRATLLIELAGHLSEDQKAELINEVLTMAPSVQGGVITDAFGIMSAIPAVQAYAEILSRAATHLSDASRIEMLPLVWQLNDEMAQMRALMGLMRGLPSTLRADILHKALPIARQLAEEKGRVEVLVNFAEYLPSELKTEVLTEALLTAQGMADKEWRVFALVRVADHLPHLSKLTVLKEILKTSRSSAYIWQYVSPKLGQLLPNEMKGEALAMAQEIVPEGSRCQALVCLAKYLPRELQETVLASVRKADVLTRAEALGTLIGFLPNDLRAEIAVEALAASHSIARKESVRALSNLALNLTGELKTKTLREAEALASNLIDSGTRETWEHIIGHNLTDDEPGYTAASQSDRGVAHALQPCRT